MALTVDADGTFRFVNDTIHPIYYTIKVNTTDNTYILPYVPDVSYERLSDSRELQPPEPPQFPDYPMFDSPFRREPEPSKPAEPEPIPIRPRNRFELIMELRKQLERRATHERSSD